MEFKIEQYSQQAKKTWDEFVQNAKNATFLFYRDYMDYHSDRFQDFSLMVYRKDKLYALLPGNRKGNTFYSHQGLTYGGLLMPNKATTVDILEAFYNINNYLKGAGIEKVIYKPTPYIYHRIPSQEDLYALFRLNARWIGSNISSTVRLDCPLRLRAGRRSGVKKAMQAGLRVVETTDFAPFWKVLEDNLQERFHVKPVHSLPEIELLHSRFPERIRLFAVKRDEEVLAGSVVYDTGLVAHAQYSSGSAEGKASGALDLLYATLIGEVFADQKWFDFGQSTEDMGHYLNEGLIAQKEGFGGRAVAYNIYEIAL